jgi:hypothetical protein
MKHVTITYKQNRIGEITFDVFDAIRFHFVETYVIYQIIKALDYSEHRMDYHSY